MKLLNVLFYFLKPRLFYLKNAFFFSKFKVRFFIYFSFFRVCFMCMVSFQLSPRRQGPAEAHCPRVLQLPTDTFTKCYLKIPRSRQTCHSLERVYVHSTSKKLFTVLTLVWKDMVGLSQQNHLWPFSPHASEELATAQKVQPCLRKDPLFLTRMRSEMQKSKLWL